MGLLYGLGGAPDILRCSAPQHTWLNHKLLEQELNWRGGLLRPVPGLEARDPAPRLGKALSSPTVFRNLPSLPRQPRRSI